MRVSVMLDSVSTRRPATAEGDHLYVILGGRFGSGRVSRVQPESRLVPAGAVAWVTRAGGTSAPGHRLHEWVLSDLESLQVYCAFAARRRARYVDALLLAAQFASLFEQTDSYLLALAGGLSAEQAILRIEDLPLGDVLITATNMGGDLDTTVFYGYAAKPQSKGVVTKGSSTHLSFWLSGSGARYGVTLRLAIEG